MKVVLHASRKFLANWTGEQPVVIILMIEIDGYYVQALLQGAPCTLCELTRMYAAVREQASSAYDVPPLFVAHYGFTLLPYNPHMHVAFVIDTDTNRLYVPTYT